MKILVTGATGFIGRHVVEAASARGHEVFPLVRAHSAVAGLERHQGRFRSADLRDEAALRQAVEGIEAIIHLGGLTRAKSEAAFRDVNSEGVARIARSAREAAPDLRRILLVSSAAAGGPGTPERPRRESETPEPVTAYGRSKLAGEAALQGEAGGVPWTIVRPPIVYGPFERDLFALFKAARRGFVPDVGFAVRSYSHVYGPDLAEALVRLVEEPAAAGQIFNVAATEPASGGDLLAAIGGALGRKVRSFRLPVFLARLAAGFGTGLQPFLKKPPLLTLARLPEILAPGWVVSTEKIRTLLPDVAQTSITQGCLKTADWYRAQGWL